MTGQPYQRVSRYTLPLWGILHTIPIVFIIPLAPQGSMSVGNQFVVGLLTAVLLGSVYKLFRVMTAVDDRSPADAASGPLRRNCLVRTRRIRVAG